MNQIIFHLFVLVMGVAQAKTITTNADSDRRILVLQLGKPMSLVCNSSAPIDGDATVTWTKSDGDSAVTPLETGDGVVVTSYPGGSTVTILKATGKDVGNYTCRFVGGHPDAEAIIQIAKNATAHISGKSITVKEGKDLSIPCKVTGSPMPKIRWTKNGEDIYKALNNSERLSFAKNDEGLASGILKLEKLSHEADVGDYCCVSSNLVGTHEKCVTVRVKGKLAALWPFIGIVAEVIILTAIIYIYEKKRGKAPDMDDSETDQTNDRSAQGKGDVRQRK